jgi:hypothetical protein
MPARSEQIRAAAEAIRRHATVAGIKRRALGLAPMTISDDIFVGGQPVLNLIDARRWLLANGEAAALGGIGPAPRMPRRARPVFVLPGNARLRQLMMSCICRRRAG